MNSRIQELAEQAGFISWKDESWKPQDAVFDWGTTYDAELEKFAELIVSECAELVALRPCIDDGNWPHPSEMIKQHFGVQDDPE